MANEPKARRPFWQFTLRELLLAMTAAGALAALAVKSMTSPATPFYNAFDATHELEFVMRQLGVKLGSGGGGRSGESRPGSRRSRWEFASHQTTVPLGEIAVAYDARIQSLLHRHGCNIRGNGSSGNRKDKSLRGFNYSYRRGATWGELDVEFIDAPDGTFRVFAYCIEYTHR